MRSLLIQNQSGNTQSFTPEKSTRLVNATASGNFVMSQDPTLVFNDINNPPSDRQRSDIQFAFFGTTFPLNVKILAGQQYFLAFGGAGNSALLFFEP